MVIRAFSNSNSFRKDRLHEVCELRASEGAFAAQRADGAVARVPGEEGCGWLPGWLVCWMLGIVGFFSFLLVQGGARPFHCSMWLSREQRCDSGDLGQRQLRGRLRRCQGPVKVRVGAPKPIGPIEYIYIYIYIYI